MFLKELILIKQANQKSVTIVEHYKAQRFVITYLLSII